MAALVLVAAFAAIVIALPGRDGVRDRFLRALVLFGVILFVITEVLSIFQAMRPVPLFVAWLVVAGVAAGIAARSRRSGPAASLPARKRGRSFRVDPVVLFCSLASAVILVLTAIAALYSPPNSADAMAYHMPRVVYWAEQGSIRFFPTPYFNQIMLQPFAEYSMLHTYVLSGGDHLINLVQWVASLASVMAVSSVAAMLGAGSRGQAVAALFCATLPSGILASSGAKNDYVVALWLMAAIYFGARLARRREWSDAGALGGALGLALLTKATAYLFAPWLLLAVLAPSIRQLPRQLGAAGLCALLLNTPHFVRNRQLSGSILGFDSAHGDGFFRWRNEAFGWKQTASNALRSVSDQLGARSESWNRGVYAWVVRTHAWLGIDVNDPATTWRWSTFEAPRNANHEANANSHWHLLVLLLAAGILACRALFRRAPAVPVLYVLALACGFLAFCAYLKWQPYLARLLLPLLVAGAPPVGAAMGRRIWVPALLCLFLLSTARLPATENWTRPLRGARSVFRVSRQDQYFSDMVQWGDRPTYLRTLEYFAAHPCNVVGIDITDLPLEYPLMALLRQQQPGTVFVHTGVQNVSTRYAPSISAAPCAVVCLDCAGDAKRESLYASFPQKTVIDKFLVFGSR